MDDMDLPEGKTCEDCHWFEKCVVLFRCPAESTRCDFAPSRFNGDDHQHVWKAVDSTHSQCRICGEIEGP